MARGRGPGAAGPLPLLQVYELYLTAMIDFHNREMESYQNDMEAFNDA